MVQGWVQIIVFVAVLFAVVPLLGGYMARVFTNERVFLTPVVGPLERLVYRCLRVDVSRSQDWKSYAGTLLVFSGLFWLALYLILRTQTLHPFNPDGFHSGTWDLTFNTVSSFITNTNWQFYGGETTLSFFSQMAGLAVQNFVSAAVGIVVGDRADPRHRRASRRRGGPRQLLAGPDARAAVRVAADRDRRRARARVPGRRAVAVALGPGGLTGDHQGSSGPTAAASSTSTPRSRSRTRTG